MGAIFSRKTNSEPIQKFTSFYELLDYIATYYILTMDFESLQKLSDPKYCDELIVITSDIVSKYFNELEIQYLEQRTKEGIEINDMTKEKVIFLTKNHLENLDIKNDRNKSIRKKRVCIGIAKFYVTIANIYAAIMTTLNPQFIYKDPSGEVVKKDWKEKNNVPKNAQVKNKNICEERIKSLSIGIPTDESISEYDLKPGFCSFNADNDLDVLTDEAGISELEKLYYDVYNYSTGTFDSMSPSAKKDYETDLQSFFYAFTDSNSSMPDTIQKFSDIKLRDISGSEKCAGDSYAPKHVSKNDNLFMVYANHIKGMIKGTIAKQKALTSVLNNLFLPVIDPYTKEKRIRIHPKLNDAGLRKNVKKTRDIIVELYTDCEKEYLKGALLYEQIIGNKMSDTLNNQLENLYKDKTEIISNFSKSVKEPEVPIIEESINLEPVSENMNNVPLQAPLNSDIEPPGSSIEVENPIIPEVNLEVEKPFVPEVNLEVEKPFVSDITVQEVDKPFVSDITVQEVDKPFVSEINLEVDKPFVPEVTLPTINSYTQNPNNSIPNLNLNLSINPLTPQNTNINPLTPQNTNINPLTTNPNPITTNITPQNTNTNINPLTTNITPQNPNPLNLITTNITPQNPNPLNPITTNITPQNPNPLTPKNNNPLNPNPLTPLNPLNP